MAFGMRNAPATFQRLVNIHVVLAGVPNCNAYLDDLVVNSSKWSEHIALLKVEILVHIAFLYVISPHENQSSELQKKSQKRNF